MLNYAAIGDIKISPVALKLDAGTFLGPIAQGAVSVRKLKKRALRIGPNLTWRLSLETYS